MPTYEYECRNPDCGYKFDLFQSMTEDHKKRCPKCQKDTLHRLIGAGAGIIFKGSGFYETDYKNNHSSQKSAKKESNTETSAPAAEPSKVDTQTASSPADKSTDKPAA